MAKASIAGLALNAVAKGVAAIDEHLRNPPILSGIQQSLGAVSARLEDVEIRLSRVEAMVAQLASGTPNVEAPKRKRATRRTRG